MMIDKLIQGIIKTKNPTIVGLDPRLEYIPEFLKAEAFQKFGKTPKAVAWCFLQFNKGLIDAFCDLVPAVKPQIAMYEQYGVEGLQAYLDTINYAKRKGLLVIGDIKRSDIGSTAEAYANGHLGLVSIDGEKVNIYDEDFVTVNPYLGYDGIKPFVEECKSQEKGIFVLVKTSNPSSSELQDLLLQENDGVQANAEPVYLRMANLVKDWGKELIGQYGYSEVGAVVGATFPEQSKACRAAMPNTFFLIPGYGAQGGSAQDFAHCFEKRDDLPGVPLGGIVNSSRGIIAAYKTQKFKAKDEDYAQAARQAVLDMREDLCTQLL